MKTLLLFALLALASPAGLAIAHTGVPEATSGFRQPMDGYAANGYAFNVWSTESSCYHPGIDYNAYGYSGNNDLGWDIFAVANGLVVDIRTDAVFGLCMAIEHSYNGTTVFSQYGHLDATLVSVGNTVTKGQHVAELGNSGSGAATAHLHWEIREADHPNPHLSTYWSGSLFDVQANIDNWYEDPQVWCNTHGPYSSNPYAAAYVSKTISPAGPYLPGQTVTCTVTYRNDGTATWSHTPGANYVELASCNDGAVIGRSFFNCPEVASLGWLNVQVPCTFTQATVTPGNNATFSFTGRVRPDATAGTHNVYFGPVYAGAIMTGWAGNPYVVNVQAPPPVVRTTYDFDHDGLSDVWDRTSTGEWHIDFSANGFSGWEWTGYGYGSNLDIPCPADYDGDGFCDIAVLWNSDRTWRIDYFGQGCGFGGFDETYGGYGQSPDYPLPADYDGDGKADLAVRTADGYWRIDKSSVNGFSGWDVNEPNRGGTIDTPSTGDFDGDGKADLAVLRNSDRKFLIDYAANGWSIWDVTNLGGYGGSGDTPCPADYDGDGVTDIAVRWTSDRCIRIDYYAGGFNGWQGNPLCGYGGSGDPIRSGRYDSDLLDDVVVYYAQDGQLCVDKASDGFGGWHQCYGGYPTWKPGPYDPPGDGDATFQFAFTVDQPIRTQAATLRYVLPEQTAVSLRIYDIAGRSVATLVDADQAKGEHLATWRSSGNASGIYFARLIAGARTATQRVLLLK